MKKLLGYLLAATLSGAAPAWAAEVPPDVLVKNTVSEVLAVIRQDKDIQAGDKKKVAALAETKVLPHFDFVRMTRLAVGKYWRQASASQQQILVEEFRTLLVRTYTAAFTAYKNQTVEFKPFRMQPGDTDVTVRTAIVQPGGQPPIPVDYSMEKTASGWKVYDVTIDGVSLVTTYRGTFSQEIQRGGIDGLIKSLQQKNQALATVFESTAKR